MKINDLKQQRASLVKEMRNILDNPRGEHGAMSADQETSYENMQAEVDALGKQVDRLQNIAELERATAGAGRDEPIAGHPQSPEDKILDEDKVKAKKKEFYSKAFFDGYCRNGYNRSRPEFRNALEAGEDTEGGYLVPEEWSNMIIKALAEINVIRRYADVVTTSVDRNYPAETTRGTFGGIDEEASYGESDPVFGTIQIGAHKGGGIIKVSEELLQDNAFNLVGYLQNRAVENFDLLEEAAFCSGDGSGKPTGIFATTAVAGVNLTGTTAASTSTVTADELIDTYHGLARRYRTNATWVTGDPIAKIIRKLKDSDNQYLWQPGLVAGEPDRLLGRPFEVTDSAPAIAASAKTIMFGDLGYYHIGDRLGMTAQRLDELYAASGQVGFRFHKRTDAKLMLAGAMTYLVQAAS